VDALSAIDSIEVYLKITTEAGRTNQAWQDWCVDAVQRLTN
jgi:hypothetical protein